MDQNSLDTAVLVCILSPVFIVQVTFVLRGVTPDDGDIAQTTLHPLHPQDDRTRDV